jgi:hypothetical protein
VALLVSALKITTGGMATPIRAAMMVSVVMFSSPRR